MIARRLATFDTELTCEFIPMHVHCTSPTSMPHANCERIAARNFKQPDSGSSKPTHHEECDSSGALVASNVECERPPSVDGGVKSVHVNTRTTTIPLHGIVRICVSLRFVILRFSAWRRSITAGGDAVEVSGYGSACDLTSASCCGGRNSVWNDRPTSWHIR